MPGASCRSLTSSCSAFSAGRGTAHASNAPTAGVSCATSASVVTVGCFVATISSGLFSAFFNGMALVIAGVDNDGVDLKKFS